MKIFAEKQQKSCEKYKNNSKNAVFSKKIAFFCIFSKYFKKWY